MTPFSRLLLLASAAAGLGAAATSSYVHYNLLTQSGYSSFCDVSSTVSCTQAYLSQYGSFMGVPVALFGVVFFAAVLIIAGVAGREGSTARESAPGYIFALSTLALAFSLYLAYGSYFVLKTFCVLCAITYAAVIAIFIVSGGATTFPMTKLPDRARRDIRTLISSPSALIILLLFVAGSGTLLAVFPRDSAAQTAQASAAAAPLPPVTAEQRAKLAEWWELQPKVDVPVSADGAKVVIVKFNDYQCPPCRLTHQAYKPIIAKHSANGAVKYVLKHFALERECNPGKDAGHYAACEAAAAVIMAQPKGTASKMEEWLFANQGPPILTSVQVKEAAQSVAGITDFDAQYPAALQTIAKDVALGDQLKVNSTPTFFINGRRVPEILQPQYFEVLIELELNRTQ